LVDFFSAEFLFLFTFDIANNVVEMTSILPASCYQDLIEIDSLRNFNLTIEQEPLAIILELALGMKKKSYWERGYKATWKIENSKLYLKDIISNYKGDNEISMRNLFSKHFNKFGEKNIFADWYSGKITLEINYLTNYQQSDQYDCITYLEITIIQGRVVSQNEICISEKELPF
jgi:hypothetical protein